MNDQNRNFQAMLEAKWRSGKFVCVGLDSDYDRIPEAAKKMGVLDTLVTFNEAIIDATKNLVCAFKPNIAFYEKHADAGINALFRTIIYIRTVAPDVPVILDFKRADIGNTNSGYIQEAFQTFKADAVTVNPYLGREALQPFLDLGDKGIIVLCRTSNPGADEFQNLLVDNEPLYCIVARHIAETWNKKGNCAVVVGATCPEELGKVRSIVGDMPILIPGIGAQGGDLQKTVIAGMDSRGGGMIINSSRSIIFASKDADFADAAHQEMLRLHNMISQYRREKG